MEQAWERNNRKVKNCRIQWKIHDKIQKQRKELEKEITGKLKTVEYKALCLIESTTGYKKIRNRI